LRRSNVTIQKCRYYHVRQLFQSPDRPCNVWIDMLAIVSLTQLQKQIKVSRCRTENSTELSAALIHQDV
jgi:hypothetical protein